MVVPVDEARQQDILAGTDDRYGRMLTGQFGESANGNDGTVLLQHRTIGDLFPTMTIDGARNQRTAADQRCRHSPLLNVKTSCQATCMSCDRAVPQHRLVVRHALAVDTRRKLSRYALPPKSSISTSGGLSSA